MTWEAPSKRTLDEMLRRAELHAAAAGMTIGIRRYDAATDEITTVQEPVQVTGHEPPSNAIPRSWPLSCYPLCECPQAPACRERRTDR